MATVRTWVRAKVHGVRVTDKSVEYNGSVSLSRALMDAVDLAPYEQVHVVNLTNGARWVTYVLPVDVPGVFTLNGGGARLGEIGDACVLLAYETADTYHPARVIFCDAANAIRTARVYGADS